MYDNFSQQSLAIIERAKDKASTLGEPTFGTEHILLALLEETEGVVKDVFTRTRIIPSDIDHEVRIHAEQSTPKSASSVPPSSSENVRGSLEAAKIFAHDFESPEVNPEHILLGIIENGKGTAVHLIRASMVAPEEIRGLILAALRRDIEVQSPAPHANVPAAAATGLSRDEIADELRNRITELEGYFPLLKTLPYEVIAEDLEGVERHFHRLVQRLRGIDPEEITADPVGQTDPLER